MVVAATLSDSERSSELYERRLVQLSSALREAVDCESGFIAVLIGDRRITELTTVRFDSDLGTEAARDVEVPRLADPVMAEIEAALADYMEEDPPEVSDPGIVFQYLADLSSRSESGQRVTVVILSDGITVTPILNLNRPLEANEVENLARQVAPDVYLDGVDIDWMGLGVTNDPHGAPADYTTTLKQVWERACALRSSGRCVITTTI